MGKFKQTIAALSTPAGESGIAVVRISGGESLKILSGIFRLADKGMISPEKWEHRKLYHGRIVSPDGEEVDEVMCAVLKEPESYTGEDVIEISCHGSMLIVNRILGLTYAAGARAAEAGEFTKRAFLNGKIDLIQAEAVCDLISARSELQRKVAKEQLSGSLSLRIGKLADEMLSILADVEAGIDFVEEDIELFDRSEARKKIERQLAILNELLADAALSRPFREGYRVALTGPVNAGKSSIFNRITGETRAIVTEIPGTTRDVLREPVIMEGLLFLFQDTAGLRDQIGDRVEAIGVNLAKGAIEAADIVVFVLDSSITLCKETMAGIENLPRSNSIVALNKKDLPVAVTVGYFAELLPGFCTVAVSAKTGEGFGGLRQALLECAGKERISRIANERVILNARLISLLREARDESRSFADLLKSGAPLEILAVAIRSVLHNYEEALGRRYSENLLANIFSRFCIGK